VKCAEDHTKRMNITAPQNYSNSKETGKTSYSPQFHRIEIQMHAVEWKFNKKIK
jgi:hypothetical protein